MYDSRAGMRQRSVSENQHQEVLIVIGHKGLLVVELDIILCFQFIIKHFKKEE